MRSASEQPVAVSALHNDGKQMELRAGAKEDFETKQSSVFAAPGLPLAHFLTAESGFNLTLGCLSEYVRPDLPGVNNTAKRSRCLTWTKACSRS
jgi:hypothetical protein